MAQGQNKNEQSWGKCPYHSSEARATVNVHVSNYTCSDKTKVQGVKQKPIQKKLPKVILSSETTT